MTDNELMNEGMPKPATSVAPLPSTPPSAPPELILTEEQQKVVDLILAWSKQRTIKEFKLGGYAGTGKTTVVKHIIKG